MPGYITLYKYTQQGLKDIKNAPARIAAAKAAAEKMGLRSIGVWMTLGEYDLISVGEAPDDQAAAAFALVLGGQGNVTSVTMRAFSEDEIKAIVGRLP